MGRHVKKEKVNDDPEQNYLDEIENVNGVKMARLEVRFEEKRQACGTKPEYGDEDGEIFEKWRGMSEGDVKIDKCSGRKEYKGDGRYVTKISREVSRAACSFENEVETQKIEEEIAHVDKSWAGHFRAPGENNGHLGNTKQDDREDPEIPGKS
jgi:hypothetical protein